MVLGHRNGHRHASASVGSADGSTSSAAPLSEKTKLKSSEPNRERLFVAAIRICALLATTVSIVYVYILCAKWMMNGDFVSEKHFAPVNENGTWSLRGRLIEEKVGLGKARQHPSPLNSGKAKHSNQAPHQSQNARLKFLAENVDTDDSYKQLRQETVKGEGERTSEKGKNVDHENNNNENNAAEVRDKHGVLVTWPHIMKKSSRTRLLLTSAGDSSNIQGWLSPDRSYDIIVLYYGNQVDFEYASKVDLVVKRKGTKFPGAKEFAEHYGDRFKSYSSVALFDDDIIITPRGIEDLFHIREKTGEAMNIYTVICAA